MLLKRVRALNFIAVGDVQLEFMEDNFQSTDELFIGSFFFFSAGIYVLRYVSHS